MRVWISKLHERVVFEVQTGHKDSQIARNDGELAEVLPTEGITSYLQP
jgi:hypothetical protein